MNKAGAEVRAPIAYRTEPAIEDADRLRDLLAGEKLDAVTFTSASTVEHCLALLTPHEVDYLNKAVDRCHRSSDRSCRQKTRSDR